MKNKELTFSQAEKILKNSIDIIRATPTKTRMYDIIEIVSHTVLQCPNNTENSAFKRFPELLRYKPDGKKDYEPWFSMDESGAKKRIAILASILQERMIKNNIKAILKDKLQDSSRRNKWRLSYDLYLVVEEIKKDKYECVFFQTGIVEGDNSITFLPNTDAILISKEDIDFTADIIMNGIIDYYNERGKMI